MTKSTSKKKDLVPEIGDFSKFFKSRSKFSESMTDVISNVYEWSTSLDPSSEDNLPLPFVSKNEEVVWSYLKHQNKQLDGINKKYKGFLSELIGKPHIRISKKINESEDSDDNPEDVEDDDMDDEEMEDDMDDEEEDEMGSEDDDEDVDLFNLKESDLKTLDADLKKMAEEDDEEDVDGSKKTSSGDSEEPKKFKKSIVDDEFFSLEEMHDYLQKTERKQAKKAQEEDMMFEDEDSWDGKTDYTYEDFFGSREAPAVPKPETIAKKPKSDKKRKAGQADLSVDEGKNTKKRVRFAMDEQEPEEEEEDPEDVDNEENVEDEEDSSDHPLLLGADLEEKKEESGFEKRQNKMKERISKLEEENLAPKSWELSGEVAADQRDQNTLLEKHVDFDHGSKRAPEVTEEFTDRLESLIKQRIKDKSWDDVIRVKKVDAKNARFETEAIENTMNQKTSLAEVYEKEFEKAAGNSGENGQKVENPAHETIKTKMGELFRLLDALTHFEYKPEQARDEVRVVSNMAALRVEEVGITASTEGQLMAPEEVSKKMRSIEKGKEERDSTDRARERRQKKAKQRSMLAKFGEEKVFGEQKAARKEKSERGKDKNGVEKIKSSNFFSKLQETVQNEKKAGGAVTKKKKIVKRLKTDKNSAAIKL